MRSDKELGKIATKVRKEILMMSYKAQVGHVGSSFSIVEILIELYFRILRVNPIHPNMAYRDRFILSKGHAAPALYAVLKEKGFLSQRELNLYCCDGGVLEEHPNHRVKGIEISTGSLGHGLSIGIGMALAAKLKKSTFKVFVLLSDAECDEGQTWEAILSAAHFNLDNLIVYLDYNKVQALGKKKDVLNIEPLTNKWETFGWSVAEADGHDFKSLHNAYLSILQTGNPKVVICHTVRGKGVSFMEHVTQWHYLNPTKQHVKKALRELR